MGERGPGVHRHGAGWRAVVSQGRDRPPIRQTFPLEATQREIQAWRADTRAAQRVSRKRRATRGQFAADAQRYLAAVTALPSYAERARHIRLWVDEFGARQRDTITAADIRAVRDRLLTTPRAPGQPPYAPHTVNLRLRALSNMYTVLDGPRAENPVRAVPEADEPESVPKAIPYEAVRAILAALPDRGRPVKGETRPTRSLTKVRLRCLAFCQITPAQLMALTPEDLDLTRGRIRLPARAKGKGAQAVTVSLLPEAVAAFLEFDALDLYGRFSWKSLSQTWHRAVKNAGYADHITPYQLRHSFGTLIYRATKSRDAVQQLMQHASWQTSRRYALAAEDDVRAAHGHAVATFFQGQQSGTTSPAPAAVFKGDTGVSSVSPKPARAAKPGRKTRQTVGNGRKT